MEVRFHMLFTICLGKVKNLDKDNFARFRIEKISWDVHWQTNLYLAVIIRDYLRFFIKNTLAIGNCVIDDHGFLNELYYVGDDEFSKQKNAKQQEKNSFMRRSGRIW